MLLYWDFPFASKTFIGNLPFMLFLPIGTVPLYLVAYGVARMLAQLGSGGRGVPRAPPR